MGAPGREGRIFFFEKKKQKTFANGVRRFVRRGDTGGSRNGQIFLVLFFKKEGLLLPFVPLVQFEPKV
jgi:hypothetical protein